MSKVRMSREVARKLKLFIPLHMRLRVLESAREGRVTTEGRIGTATYHNVRQYSNRRPASVCWAESATKLKYFGGPW